jgi:hypothetical protein
LLYFNSSAVIQLVSSLDVLGFGVT